MQSKTGIFLLTALFFLFALFVNGCSAPTAEQQNRLQLYSLLDEPAAGLDPRGRREILGGLTEYVKHNDATVILVSHSMEDMASYCDNVVVMNRGEVFRCGTVDEIFSDADALEEIGLDVPAVAKIASAMRKQGIDLSGRLYTVDGVRDAIIEYIGRENG